MVNFTEKHMEVRRTIVDCSFKIEVSKQEVLRRLKNHLGFDETYFTKDEKLYKKSYVGFVDGEMSYVDIFITNDKGRIELFKAINLIADTLIKTK